MREQISPGLSPLESVPLVRLVRDTIIADTVVCVTSHEVMPAHMWGMTTFEDDRAWIWLNKTAWREVRTGTERTRFTIAHELGHVALHGEELVDLFTRPEPEHHARLEREANRFAAHLLVPDAALKRLRLDATALARRFGVSVPMAGKRIEEWSTRA